MKSFIFKIFFIVLAGTLTGCADPGEDGTAGIDCGEFGSEHDGHCHCSEGFGFNGETCVALSQITELCTADEHSEVEHTDEHESCKCPEDDATECACEGELIMYGEATYCLPALHEDE